MMMEKKMFFADIDGTLIFSAKNRRESDIVVETKNGEPISCVSAESAQLFSGFRNVVPVTTRSVEQYRRIKFPGGFSPKYAIVDNGGILLINGRVCDEWCEIASRFAAECESSFFSCREILEADPDRCFEIRMVDGLFLFTKSKDAEKTAAAINNFDNLRCFAVGEKVYAIPKKIDKGAAARELTIMTGFTGEVICEGDNFPDVSLLNFGDVAVFPEGLEGVFCPKKLTAPRDRFCDFAVQIAAEKIPV